MEEEWEWEWEQLNWYSEGFLSSNGRFIMQ